jgi:ketosteroid isomerase-like protein
MKKKDIINKYFASYAKHDMDAIRKVMDENVTWYFMGQHPFAGVKHGLIEVIEFFDKMAAVMGQSKPEIEKLIESENDNYYVECIHSKTNNPDGPNLDHYACVLWKIENDKIVEGRHFFANQEAVDNYFSKISGIQNTHAF